LLPLTKFAALSLLPATSVLLAQSLKQPPNASFDVESLSRQGLSLLSRGAYPEAASVFEKGAALTAASKNFSRQIRFLNAAAGAYFSGFQYHRALPLYLEASRIAQRIRDPELAGIVATNLSSLYSVMGEPEAAREIAMQGSLLLPARSRYRAALLVQLGLAEARSGRPDIARRALEEGIVAAEQSGDDAAVVSAWDRLGLLHLSGGDLNTAEAALTEAFRIRKLRKLAGLPVALRNLGRLRILQGRLNDALNLLNSSIQISNPAANTAPVWSAHADRGFVHQSQGRFEAALADYAAAIRIGEGWRAELPPSGWIPSVADVSLSTAYEQFALLSAAQGQAALGSGRAYAIQAFVAAERGRAASLRNWLLAGAARRQVLPEQYAPILARLRVAWTASLAQPQSDTHELNSLRAKLAELEAAAGTVLPPPGGSLTAEAALAQFQQLQARLPEGTALVSFQFGENQSVRWEATRNSFRQTILRGAKHLGGALAAARDAVAASRDGTGPADASRELFSGMDPSVLRCGHWILSLDGSLFSLPFAALPLPGHPGALIGDRYALRVTPSALLLLAPNSKVDEKLNRFLAIGDPIYNRADPRNHQFDNFSAFLSIFLPNKIRTKSALEMPRLVGSGAEIRRLRELWGHDRSTVLEGLSASREQLVAALQSKAYSVVHFATHVFTDPKSTPSALVHAAAWQFTSARGYLDAPRPPETFIALSRTSGAAPSLLSATEISHLNTAAALVVLNGCSSGSGSVLPGAGLFGMTRAWLVAGAGAVLATYWPVPDDSGMFFEEFYRHFRKGSGSPAEAALALQRTQDVMRRSNSWHSSPSYWGAYFLVGKE